MRKLTVLAMLAAVLMAGSAFAVQRHLTPSPNYTTQFGIGGAAFGPNTTNNDDTCDISTAPAATLLLPFFDVDFKSPQTTARTTLFTITNVSNLPQIAHVTVWTDWSFPALDFNIFLTGYDVQPINLYDIFARGVIAPPSGTSSTNIATEGTVNATAGSTPATANPLITLTNCTSLPGPIPPGLLTDIQAIFTTGVGSGVGVPCTVRVGGTHNDAIGYITVDVNANCNTSLPNTFTYFTTNILFDNVLIGDYQDINPNPATGNYAGGNPMVHIRAVPEGGAVGSNPTVAPGGPTNLPFTFYDRYTVGAADRRIDRRQPLPALFAARYIVGGTGAFNTNYKIWREGFTVGGCSTGATGAINNSSMAITELVRFDEHENSTSISGATIISPAPPGAGLPEASASPLSGAVFPVMPSAAGDVAGWTYLNLHNGGSFTVGTTTTLAVYSRNNVATTAATTGTRPSQNWTIVSMFAEGRYSVDFDAAWLGNGCSGVVASGATIGPAGGVLVCPLPLTAGAGCAPAGSPVGTNTTPQ